MRDDLYDAVIVGGGPAGLSAALYLARARYRVLVVEKEAFGGQITITAEVVNYPGVERAGGRELTDTMRRQAQRFGAEFLLAEVEGLDVEGDVKLVRTSRGVLRCFAVVVATGAHPRQVGFRGETEFRGRGVAYCATCDGEFFTGRDVFVVGGGFAAAEEAMFLTRYARSVTMLVRRDTFSCARSIAEQVLAHEGIRVRFHTVLEEVSGDSTLRRAVFRDTLTGETEEYAPPDGEGFGVFVFAGYEPASALLKGLAELDPQGYVLTDGERRTAAEGVYAAGDVCAKTLRQVVTAVADGAVAATSIEKYALDMQRRTGLCPEQPSGPAKAETPSAAAQARDADDAGFLTAENRSQLSAVFARMEHPLILRAALDGRPVSAELRRVLEELEELTDKLSVEYLPPADDSERPCVRILRQDGEDTGIAFHGVPGGHELSSFVIALYNAAGPGQSLEPAVIEAIARIDRPANLKVLVSLSCTMCPELVIAAQRIAAASAWVTAEAYDLNHFPDLRERYNVMSVPCLVINDEKVSFGKKNVGQLLELLAESLG